MPSLPRGAPPARGELHSDAAPPAEEAPLLDRAEHEALMLNIDRSLHIRVRHQFFTWTQGILQNLIRHELLLCAFRNSQAAFHVDTFVSQAIDPAQIRDAYCRDTAMVPHLIKAWEENDFCPVSCVVGPSSRFAQSPFARAIERLGADVALAHGTYDVSGNPVSLFCFASRSASLRPHTRYFIKVIVPFLHLAWTRVRTARPSDVGAAAMADSVLLTSREQEILKWVHKGKSNIEIGMILGISGLTVKNHVQHILRKLNVHNRTQAVSKGLALRILGF